MTVKDNNSKKMLMHGDVVEANQNVWKTLIPWSCGCQKKT